MSEPTPNSTPAVHVMLESPFFLWQIKSLTRNKQTRRGQGYSHGKETVPLKSGSTSPFPRERPVVSRKDWPVTTSKNSKPDQIAKKSKEGSKREGREGSVRENMVATHKIAPTCVTCA
jgi:hypothetical protein